MLNFQGFKGNWTVPLNSIFIVIVGHSIRGSWFAEVGTYGIHIIYSIVPSDNDLDFSLEYIWLTYWKIPLKRRILFYWFIKTQP